MADPAVEAARRMFDALWPDQGDFEFNFASSTRDFAVGSAREALKPIRELHYPRPGSVSAMYPDPLCHCGLDWPCETARLVYSSEELDRGSM